jgi:hypothetical protein
VIRTCEAGCEVSDDLVAHKAIDKRAVRDERVDPDLIEAIH